MIAYLFPGQGSQSPGMGADVFDAFPDLVTQADEILNYSIKDLCLHDKDGLLNQTQYTQPALFTVSAFMYLQKIHTTGRKPDYVCGHSLGEYNALFAAEVFDFATGLKLVKRRGELMSQAKDGGMAAVVGLNGKEIERILQDNHLNNLAIANHNTYLQFVISGPKQEIDNAQAVFKQRNNVTFIPLNVSGAFHSRYMQDAQNKFSEYLAEFAFGIPKMPVLANINAHPYHPAVIRSNLASQITQPVKWTAIIENLRKNEHTTLEEVGPGKVLTGLVRRIIYQQ